MKQPKNKEIKLFKCEIQIQDGVHPSSIYNWSIGHILEHEFFCCGRLGSQGGNEKKWI